jgi:hypothetical protein
MMGMIDLKRIGGIEEGNEHGEKEIPPRGGEEL